MATDSLSELYSILSVNPDARVILKYDERGKGLSIETIAANGENEISILKTLLEEKIDFSPDPGEVILFDIEDMVEQAMESLKAFPSPSSRPETPEELAMMEEYESQLRSDEIVQVLMDTGEVCAEIVDELIVLLGVKFRLEVVGAVKKLLDQGRGSQ